ncbi:MBL fold metallo-hydrolase [Mycolicibacterium phlei]
MSRLGLAGLGGFAASSLISACSNTSGESNTGGGGVATDSNPKPATEATKSANQKVLDSLPFNDRSDFDDAQRGLIARPDTLTITDADGATVWDLEEYKTYIGADKPAPDSVNPSLWRNAQLCMEYGLYQVADRIYQVRGYDLSNLTLVQGDTGWILMDTLVSPETAKAALELANPELGPRPVLAVVHSHSHVDHYGGIRGVVAQEDVDAGRVKIIAPQAFVEDAVSENVIAGNAMGRRAVFMYGALLPRNPQGGVNGGLGMTVSTGLPTMIIPTDIISATGTAMTVDGVDMVFQMTPGTEAPTEMNTFFPQLRAMWMAENTTNTMHNLLTLRGAQVRDALKWEEAA